MPQVTFQKRAIFFLLTAAIVVVASLVLGEVLVRVTGIGAPAHHILHNELVMGRPHAEYLETRENINRVTLNNWGFHDREREASTAKYRVVFFGDSMVEAEQVSVDQTFTALLDRRMRESGLAVEVANAGLSGTGTGYAYMLWREFFRGRRDVDHIVLAVFTGNDLEDNSDALTPAPKNFHVFVTPAGDTETVRTGNSLSQRIVRRLSEHSAFVNTAYTRLYLLKRSWLLANAPASPGEPGSTGTTSGFDPAPWQTSIGATLKLIQRWHLEAAAEGVGFSVVVIYAPWRAADERERPVKELFVDRLAALCADQQVAFAALDFRDRDPLSIYSFDGKTLGHFNYAGHVLVADRLFDWLRDLMPPSPG
jgi:lysophospholipase L1-like esterase